MFEGWNDLLTRLSGVSKSKRNACRALHSLVERAGVTLPIPLDAISITIRRYKPLRICDAWWPMLNMHSWVSYLFEHRPQVLLGGHLCEDISGQKNFERFWECYRSIESDHPFYGSGLSPKFCIPYAFHGDEGRGRGHVPFLCISFQPLISHLGMGHCNDST